MRRLIAGAVEAVVVMTIFALFLYTFIQGAPAPVPKVVVLLPISRGELVESWWEYAWNDGPLYNGTIRFNVDGTISEAWYGNQWVGTWRLDNGTVHIVDTPESGGGTYAWAVRFERLKDRGIRALDHKMQR